MHDATTVRPPTAAPRRGPVLAYRTAVGLLVVLVGAQALLAGQLLAGSAAARTLHGILGEALGAVGLVHLAAAVVLWRPGRGPVWPIAAAVAVQVLLVTQAWSGWGGAVALHVPAGVAIFGTAVALLVAALRLPARPLIHRSDRSTT